ncbi:MAG TPA: chromosome segregation protein SMC [Euzebyales bacterium]
MHLSSLTLRGFKSFADKTTLPLEPGVTVVVGPNGSGKSNIVDALTWVLGTNRPRSLRSGAMADVIFAGAPGRPGLGRASVEITIDNSDRAVPLDFGEITIGRAMFASGETEYTINGETCRQLDIAELLSDTGLGRESHTIVSQGQLDAILVARPEERRAFIDEAAGITKHRRRKDRAVRKLDQMAEHAERLEDVGRELKRSLRPLERQAEAAARHAELTARLRMVRAERATDALIMATQRFADVEAHHRGTAAATRSLAERVDTLRAEQDAAERAVAELRPAADRAAANHFRLANGLERLRAVQTQIAERRRGLHDALDEPVMLRDPAELHKTAAAEQERLDAADQDVAARRSQLAEAATARGEADAARRAHMQAQAAESRRRAAAREHRLRWEGQVAALRSALARAVSEQARIGGRLVALREREARHAEDIAVARAAYDEQRARRDRQADAVADAEQVVARCRAATDDVIARERDAERRRAGLGARVDALTAAAAEVPDGTRGVLDASDDIIGRLAEQLTVEPGYERALGVALGPAADAVVAPGIDAAESAARGARERDDGRVRLVVGGGAGPAAWQAPDGARVAARLVHGPPEIVVAVARLLRDTVVVDDYDAACGLARRRPDLTVVTRAGELAGAGGYVVGRTPPRSTVEQQAALTDAQRSLAAAEDEANAITDEVAAARSAFAEAEQARAAAEAELRAATVAHDERAGQLRRLETEDAAYRRELEAVARSAEQLDGEVTTRTAELAQLETDEQPDVDPADDGPDVEAERLADALGAAQEADVDARVALSSAVSRRDEIARRIGVAEREAAELEQAWAAADARRNRRRAALDRCGELAVVADDAVRAAAAALETSADERSAAESRRDERQEALGALRSRLADAQREMTDHTRDEYSDQLRVTEARHVLDDARARARDLGLDPDALVDDAADPLDDDRRSTLASTEEDLARQVALLGPVNPLAVEEYEALRERQRFLAEQLDDLARSRRDLLEMIAAVDARIREIFEQAYGDVAAEFERLFERLFPGGEGRLVLTDPDELLTTGVDVQARPAGKRVSRLSLLSGGERSLVALALAFAIFAARPSPFYVLDEVEAALDDVNLQRVLDVMDEFRSTSQLIVITHQKRTMEIADVLYGVTMRAGGVSRVLSQRLTDVA